MSKINSNCTVALELNYRVLNSLLRI